MKFCEFQFFSGPAVGISDPFGNRWQTGWSSKQYRQNHHETDGQRNSSRHSALSDRGQISARQPREGSSSGSSAGACDVRAQSQGARRSPLITKPLQTEKDRVSTANTAITISAYTDNGRRRFVSWCLSNGCEWIFGISDFSLVQQKSTGKAPYLKSKYKAFKIEPLWDKEEGLNDLMNPGSKVEQLRFETFMCQAEAVWRLCNLWVRCCCVVLLNLTKEALTFRRSSNLMRS